MAPQQIHLNADHAVRLPTGVAGITLTLLSGDTVYYADNPNVTTGSTTLTSGSVSIAAPAWVKSASNSDVSVVINPTVATGSAPEVAQSAAYTKTYNTIARTIPVATAAAVATTGSTSTTPFGFTTSAQADAIPVAINALEADVLALKKLIVALITDLEAASICG